MRHFINAERNFHMTPVRNALCIFHCLPGIWKKAFHFFFAFYIILSAHITQPVLIRQFFPCLQTKQNIMGLFIFRISIMYVVRGHERNFQFPAHIQKRRINRFLGRNAVVLKFQEKIAFAETVFIFPRGLFRFIQHTFLNIPLHLARQTGGKRNNSLMKFPQDFHIHTRPVIISFRMSPADDFRKILIADIIFRQKNEMVIPVFAAGQFFIKTGVWRNINFTAENRFDARIFRGLIEINHAVHNAVVCNCRALHTEFFYPFDIFFDFIRTVQ